MSVDPFHLSAQLFTAWLLVCARVLGLFATMPLLGERTVPWQTKLGLSLLTGFLLLPFARAVGDLPADSTLMLALSLGRELMLGMLIGFLARLLFGAFQFAISALDFQLGLSFAQLVHPASDANLSVLGQLLNTLLLLLFLELNGHHVLLRTVAQTFDVLPLGTAMPTLTVLFGLLRVFGMFVALSLQIALPTVVVLLLVDLAMGIVGRVVPQLNVFLVSLPVKLLVGMATLSLTLPVLAAVVGRMVTVLDQGLSLLVRGMR